MIRLGIVDFDSSHAVEFTRRFNQMHVEPAQWVDGARVVAGCPGTSAMAPERIPAFTEQISACGVQIVDEPEAMLGEVDAVMVLSLSGQVHLQRVRPFVEAGIPCFVDKPMACSLEDVEEMVRLADENNVLLWSASALRFAEEVQQFGQRLARCGPLHGVVCYGPAKRADGNPGLFHYGIHTCEMLMTLMGSGCQFVTTHNTPGAEVVTACWSDGRLATLRGNRLGSTAYGFLAWTEGGVIHQPVSTRDAYRNLCRALVSSFQSGEPAVAPKTTLEIVQFILASLRSEQSNHQPVALASPD